jgi:DNA uptake protein ComE-like DNA-binding protein
MRLRARLARAARVAVAGVAAVTAGLAYRRQELVVVALLATGVLGGFAIDAWHRRAPALLDRLEAEPLRLAPPIDTRRPREPAPRAARAEPRARDRPAAAVPRAAPPPAPTATHPVDLDRATPEELVRLPGIGPRLAARILARRDALGGRFPSFDDFASVPGLGLHRAGLLRPLVHLAAERSAPPEAGEPADAAETRGPP